MVGVINLLIIPLEVEFHFDRQAEVKIGEPQRCLFSKLIILD
jgi:hypothetical protein